MNNLNEAREKINEIDKQMTKLFVDRMSLCKEIAEYKKANSLPILDASREEALINNNLK
ncbi:MAG: chorismate mutase, partial [Lachnospiraceae bacterium]|nr:chorismate mutase [Lachnospiraceae bacterium]